MENSKKKNYKMYKEKYIRGEISYNYIKYLTIMVCIKTILKNNIFDLIIILSLIFTLSIISNNIFLYLFNLLAISLKLFAVYKNVYFIICVAINNMKEIKQKRALYKLGEYR